MPYMYVEPEVFMEVGDEEVHYYYRNGNANDRAAYCYQVMGEDFIGFHVCDVANAIDTPESLHLDMRDRACHKTVICMAKFAADKEGLTLVEWLEKHVDVFDGEG